MDTNPVSYTHLDVYKRQGMDRVTRFNVIAMSGKAVEACGDVDTMILDKTGTITYGNRLAADFFPVGGANRSDPVSYTHLDVYKRQILWLTRRICIWLCAAYRELWGSWEFLPSIIRLLKCLRKIS